MKKTLIAVLFLGILGANAADFSAKSRFSLGAYANLGAVMGGGVEFGAAIYRGDLLQVRNFVSVEMDALKLWRDRYDSSALILHERVAVGVLMGSSVLSHMGFAYFHPYLYVGGAFGLPFASGLNSGDAFYYEMQAGMGHEFVTIRGHSFFFEIGGGVRKLTPALPTQSKNATLGGMSKFLLGYRWHF